MKVSNKAVWTLTTDSSGRNDIPSKTVDLEVGNNIFFLHVKDDYDNTKQYIILIRRRPMYLVNFRDHLNNIQYSEFVEEDGYIEHIPGDSYKKGYEFLEWYPNPNNKILSNTEFNPIFSANNYKVEFDSNGGTQYDSMNIYYDDYFSLPNITREHYNFKGWFLNNTKFESGFWKQTQDITLEAKWDPIVYNISYEMNGGSPQSLNPKHIQ